MWNTCLKASTSSRVTRPSAFAILAPRAMAAMVKAMRFVARRGSGPSSGGVLSTSGAAPAIASGPAFERRHRPVAFPSRAPRGPRSLASAAAPAAPPRMSPKIVMAQQTLQYHPKYGGTHVCRTLQDKRSGLTIPSRGFEFGQCGVAQADAQAGRCRHAHHAVALDFESFIGQLPPQRRVAGGVFEDLLVIMLGQEGEIGSDQDIGLVAVRYQPPAARLGHLGDAQHFSEAAGHAAIRLGNVDADLIEHLLILEPRGAAEIAAADGNAEALEAAVARDVIDRQRRFNPGETMVAEDRHQRQALLRRLDRACQIHHQP